MTSPSTSLPKISAFASGPAPVADSPEPHAFLEETEVTIHRLHRHVQQTLGEIPSPASDLSEGVGEGQSEPNHLFYLVTLLAILAGTFLVIFTGY